MEMTIILWLIPIIVLMYISVVIMDKRKERRELTRLEETPIKVYRYTYKIYLSDGSAYDRLANGFCSIDFEEFVEGILLKDETLEIETGFVINTENITKVWLISKETKIIKPKVNKCYDSFWLSKGYSVDEVLEREVK